MKKSIILVSLFSTLIFSSLLAAEKQVRVTADKAPIYAEANTGSYRIENVTKGTILTLFTRGESEADWYYVAYSSKRWKSQVTGFIQASMVEEVSDKPEPQPEKPKSQEVPEEKKAPEIKEEAQPEIAKPMIEKPEEPPEEVKPKPEKIEVKESVGTSPVQTSKSYKLPEPKQKEKTRPFLTIDTKPAATESIEKKDKPSADITKKMPEKLQERQPPELLVVKPETEEKKEETKIEETPEKTIPKKTIPEKEQIVPQITPKKPPQPKMPKLPGEHSFLTMNLGYGPSAGSGFGGSVQLNTKKRVSFHLGVGYYPTTYFYSEYGWAKNQVLYSAGIKYYLPLESDRLRTFVDLQYGGISVEAVRIITGFWHYQPVYENIQKSLYGPSFLVGIELRLMGSAGLNGAVGLSYNTTEWDYWERDYFLTAEVGLLIYLW